MLRSVNVRGRYVACAVELCATICSLIGDHDVGWQYVISHEATLQQRRTVISRLEVAGHVILKLDRAADATLSAALPSPRRRAPVRGDAFRGLRSPLQRCQLRELGGRESHRCRAGVFDHMCHHGRSGDRHDPRLLRHQPCEPDLRGRGLLACGPTVSARRRAAGCGGDSPARIATSRRLRSFRSARPCCRRAAAARRRGARRPHAARFRRAGCACCCSAEAASHAHPVLHQGLIAVPLHNRFSRRARPFCAPVGSLAREVRIQHRGRCVHRSRTRATDPHEPPHAHGEDLGGRCRDALRPRQASRAGERRTHLRVCAVRAFAGMQRACAAHSSAVHAGRCSAADRPSNCGASPTHFFRGTLAPICETSRAFAAFSVQVFASENRDLASQLASYNFLTQPTENTKAAEVAAIQALNLAGPTGSNPRPPA